MSEVQAVEKSKPYPDWVFTHATDMADKHYGHIVHTTNPQGWWAMYWSVMNAHGLFAYPSRH